MDSSFDVIIAGAGPVGLMLACELRLGGVSVRILEQETSPQALWKAAPMGFRGMNTSSVELLYRRGLLAEADFRPNRLASVFAKTTSFQNAGHFAGIELDANLLDLTKHKYRVAGPALQNGFTTIERIETVLAKRAEELGVVISRGLGVAKITSESESQITIETQTGEQISTKWLIGCDGGRSIIRKQAGFEFVGTEPKVSFYGIQAEFDPPNILKDGCNITKSGVYTLGPGPNVMYMAEFDGGAFDRTQEVTKDHLQQVLNRILGNEDVTIKAVHSTKTFTDRAKQTTTYRKGRILLAGDAAHIHAPMGSQGLNAGLGDAFNLGWKLAATIRQEASTHSLDTTLLDTYEKERHPIGAWIMDWTRAQIEIMQPNPHGAAIRKMMEDLLATPDGNNHFVDLAWGLSQHYDFTADGDHPLLGCSAPDVEFEDGSRLGSKLLHGRGLLIEFGSESRLSSLIGKQYKDRVEYLAIPAKDSLGLQAILIRPDGYVAWASEQGSTPDTASASAAVDKWFRY